MTKTRLEAMFIRFFIEDLIKDLFTLRANLNPFYSAYARPKLKKKKKKNEIPQLTL